MRDGKLYTKLVMLLLAAGLFTYFGVYIIDSLYNPFSTTIAYSYTMNDSVEVEGILIRDEYLLAEQSGIVESLRREGERVGTGQSVALVHRDAQAQSDQAALDALTDEISVLAQVLSTSADVLSASNQDEAILQSVIALRKSAATQSLSQLDDQVVDLKSNVLQRDYAYSGTLTQAEILDRLTVLQAEKTSLSATTSGSTTVYAPFSGLYSSYIDGFESLLSPSTMDSLTEATLQQYLSYSPQTSSNRAGKLILGDGWYLALSVPQEAISGLRTGDSLTVRFGGEFSQDVTMTITQIGDDEGSDSRLLILYSDRYASDTTLLRQTTVELVYDSYTGLRIPKESLRMQDGVLGVYAITAGRAEFRTVNILVEGGDFYVVEAAEPGKDVLRAGDEIVVYGTDLYDGKQLN